MEEIGGIIKNNLSSLRRNTVNSNNKSFSTVNSNNTVNSKTVSEQVDELLEKHKVEPEGVAQLLTELLDDSKSIDYFLILAKENSPGKLLEAAHCAKEAHQRGIIKINKSVYFLGILKKWGIKTKFKKGHWNF